MVNLRKIPVLKNKIRSLPETSSPPSWPYAREEERWNRRIKDWIHLIGRALFGPLCLPFDLIAGGAEAIEHRSKHWQRQLQGLPNKLRTVELNGALRDVVNAFAGATLGLSVTNFFTESGPSLLHAALLYGAVIAIFVFHFYELSQRRSSQTGSWEPGAGSKEALQTLHEEWRSKKRSGVAWPHAAAEGSQRAPSYIQAWRTAQPSVIAVSLAIPGLLLGATILFASDIYKLRLLVILLAVAITNYASNCLALWFTMKNGTWDIKRFNARNDRLLDEIATEQEQERKAALARNQHEETSQMLERLATLLENTPATRTRSGFLQRLKDYWKTERSQAVNKPSAFD